MVKILIDEKRKEKEKIHKELDEIDSILLNVNYRLRQIKEEFKLIRDVNLIDRIRKKLLWCANKTLLLKGRITVYELGSNLFMEQEYLQFHYRRVGKPYPRNLKYIPLFATNYSGKKFRNFMKYETDAKAHVSIEDDKITILSILIPRNKKNLIVYN